jgi:hypothetical protein
MISTHLSCQCLVLLVQLGRQVGAKFEVLLLPSLALLCLLSTTAVVARVTVFDAGKVFVSKPDRKLRLRLCNGCDCMGRLQ